jgi:hypothetical protein
MLLIYLVAERYYFADGEIDLVVLGYVAPRAALAAVLPAITGAMLLPERWALQVILGVLGGPLFGWVAIKAVNIYSVLS